MVNFAFTILPVRVPRRGRMRMMQGRREMSSAEQLVELRKARDRYKALADRFREEGNALAGRVERHGDPVTVMQEKLAHERDARRIANAYEKSIANIEVSSSLMRQAQTTTPRLQSIGTRPALLAVFLITAALGTLIIADPGFYRRTLSHVPDSASVQDYFMPMRPVVTLDAVSRPSAPVPQPHAAKTRPAAEIRSIAKTKPHGAAPSADVFPVKQRSVRKERNGARESNSASRHEGDFTVKVLQPDGTLKEQVFSAQPRPGDGAR